MNKLDNLSRYFPVLGEYGHPNFLYPPVSVLFFFLSLNLLFHVTNIQQSRGTKRKTKREIQMERGNMHVSKSVLLGYFSAKM